MKKFTLEECNDIEKAGANYIRRIKKVIELKVGRLEDIHLRKIKRESNEEEKEYEENKEESEDKQKEIN